MTAFVFSADRALMAQFATTHKALVKRNQGRLVTIKNGKYEGRKAKIIALQVDLDNGGWLFVCRVYKQKSSDFLALNALLLSEHQMMVEE